jgi:hypothetical protein
MVRMHRGAAWAEALLGLGIALLLSGAPPSPVSILHCDTGNFCLLLGPTVLVTLRRNLGAAQLPIEYTQHPQNCHPASCPLTPWGLNVVSMDTLRKQVREGQPILAA